MKRYAYLYLTQQGVLSEDQLNEIGKEYRPKDPIPRASFLRMMKTHEAKSMLKSELKALMSEHGITPERVIHQHQEIITEARNSGQLAVAEKANSRFIEMLDLMPDKKVVSETQRLDISWDHLTLPSNEAPVQIAETAD